MTPGIYERIYQVVAQIPAGRVVTYGQIALHLGMPQGARTVGWAMRNCPEGLAWHRVINAQGRISLRTAKSLQRALLEEEGIVFDLSGKIDLAVYGWDGI
ncbi:MAG: hypothetical protein A2Y73_06545 [Chloroflexi bacterium RBG_13_56_8]|nr:MAG: hypothetical protein A2Y73_06545 [Chloroflexi bacterium RBG_13_56_8]